jgi:hypothetical protein
MMSYYRFVNLLKNIMYKKIVSLLFLFCLVSLPLNAFAQHCPFDGLSMIVIHLVDRQGNAIKNFKGDLVLHEVDNAHPELCTYATDLVKEDFIQAKTAFYETRDTDRFKDTLDKYCPDCTFLEPGYYAAKLTQATEECMIKHGDDFDYKKRKYEVQLTQYGMAQTVPIPEKRVYSLCTAQGRWSRIQPIDVVVKSNGKGKRVE